MQIGVPHKAQKDSVGWAWASPLKDADAVAANRLSHLVSITLQSEVSTFGQEPLHIPSYSNHTTLNMTCSEVRGSKVHDKEAGVC